MTGAFSWWHWAIVLIVVVILFGSKKLPEAARGLGRSMRIFKSEIKEMQNEGAEDEPDDPAQRELTQRELTQRAQVQRDGTPAESDTDPDPAKKSA